MPGSENLFVAQFVGALGALTPDEGSVLAQRVLVAAAEGSVVTLDFSDVRAVTSSFANALFLTLAEARPLPEWRAHLRFVNVPTRAADVITSSLRAARAFTADARRPA